MQSSSDSKIMVRLMMKNYPVLNALCSFVLIFFISQTLNAQCAAPIAGCSNTNLSNFGSDSNNDSATIEYDNFVSSYHATIVRTSDGSFQVWGEKMGSNGTSNVLTPIAINNTNFQDLHTAIPLKAALGSSSGSNVQGIILATDGLYAWSTEGAVFDDEITSGTAFQKITINGNTNGLPPGVNPGDVKMMFATYKTLVITTCSGSVWVISQTPDVRGNGGTGNSMTWYRITTADANNPFLDDVIACRGNYDGLMALRSDGSIYVWGSNILLGDNNGIIASQTRAVQMISPTTVMPKMIGSSGNNVLRSYYVLAVDGNLYTLGENSSRQLGDWTSTDRFLWVQPRYTASGPVMNDIKWFSVQEHDAAHGSANVINSNKNLYAFGQNDYNLLGTIGNSTNPVMPNGLTTSDRILAVETGGHTSMIVKNCEGNFGYAGHRVRGSMGNGSSDNAAESSYTFATAPVQICGVESLPTINLLTTGDGPDSKYCANHPVLLNLSPIGGVLSVLSGPATVNGSTLNFTGAGTVVIQYELSDGCGGVPAQAVKSFEVADCSTDLQVTKTVDNLTSSVGSNVVFTITAVNNGPYKASGVSVKDVLPAGYTFISATPSTGIWTEPDWTIGNLANGASAVLSITAVVNASGSYANTAVITGNDTDTDLSNNSSTVIPVVQTDLSVVKTANKTSVNTGDTIIFTITASNAGPSGATGVVINDILPAGYTFVSAVLSTGTWTAPNWNIGNLANGADAVLTITAVVNAFGSYTNTAVISGTQNDPVSANNTGTFTPVVNQLPIAYDDTNNSIPSIAGATAINALKASDPDGTIVSFTIATLPSHGILALNGIPVTTEQQLSPFEAANLTYDPIGTFTGNDTFTFNATDNSGAVSGNAVITIPVGNNPPTAYDAVGTVVPSRGDASSINPLTASDTDGTVVNYTIIKLPVHGVLALNGIPVAAGQILSPAEVSNLTYDPDGTFAGDDSFTFNAEDNLGASSNTAVITIVVEKTHIEAVADQKSVISTNQTLTVLNVFDNDLLDHKAIIPAEVNLNLLTPDPTGFLVLKADGTVELAPNTPAGTYTLTYEICEKINPSNCKPALVTISVEAPNITITADSYCSNNVPYVSYKVTAENFTTSELLTINWIDRNNTVVATQSNMSLTGNLLWPGITIDADNNRTNWPGWTFINGQWIQVNNGSEVMNSAFTIQFVLNTAKSVTVNYPTGTSGCGSRPAFAIEAIDEPITILADGINGSPEIMNVLDNDKLNGIPVNYPDVVVKGINFPQGIILNANGTIDVLPNTAGGNYMLTYEICEVANQSNCDTASLTIFVETPSLAVLKTVVFNDNNVNEFAEAGETLTYNFLVTNTGNVDLENIIITDPLPGITINGGPIHLAIGETNNFSFTGTYTLTQSDLNAGQVSNQAVGSGSTSSGILVSDKSDPKDINADNPTIIELNGCTIEVFNAVSLDGDGINERFYIRGLECYPDNNVQIYNRWGVLVFERDHYNNNDIAFKGISEGRTTVKDSSGLPEGTYYYIIRYKDYKSGSYQEAGYLYLTR